MGTTDPHRQIVRPPLDDSQGAPVHDTAPQRSLALVVDNDGDTREMYGDWLVYSGFRVAKAATMDEALSKARRLHPQVITTDLRLSSHGDGCMLCERLKADARTRATPIIVVTGWTAVRHIEHAHRAGCAAVLIKPCLPDELLTEIQRLLNGTPAR